MYTEGGEALARYNSTRGAGSSRYRSDELLAWSSDLVVGVACRAHARHHPVLSPVPPCVHAIHHPRTAGHVRQGLKPLNFDSFFLSYLLFSVLATESLQLHVYVIILLYNVVVVTEPLNALQSMRAVASDHSLSNTPREISGLRENRGFGARSFGSRSSCRV